MKLKNLELGNQLKINGKQLTVTKTPKHNSCVSSLT
jgi:hypothetical protein